MVTKVRGAFNDVEGIINADVGNSANSSVRVAPIQITGMETRRCPAGANDLRRRTTSLNTLRITFGADTIGMR